jgi:hypothetical protein
MGGAVLFGLKNDLDFIIDGVHGCAYGVGAVARNDDGFFGGKGGARLHGMGDEGRACDGVQNLGQIGVHPCALARRQYDKCGCHALPFAFGLICFNSF